MGGCCSSSDRKSPEDAKRQLESLFVLSNKDFVRKGTHEDMVKYFEVLEQETQSHGNCVTSLLKEKSTGDTKFCKTILKPEDMQAKRIYTTCNFMGQISHSIIVRVQEVYHSND